MRAFIFLCSPLLILVAACTSAPTARAQPSILDVLDQSEQQSPAEPRYAGGELKCPGGTVNVCVAETRAAAQMSCACLESGEVTSMFRRLP